MAPPSPSHGKLVLIIGPSGVGKSVILKRLKQNHPALQFPRSATTREKRPGEGTDLYHFVTEKQFDALLRDNKILEWAQVHGGARYGTLLEEIIPPIEAGKTVVREVDVQGFVSISKHLLFSIPGATYRLQSIFILPENKEQLIQRITRRAPISKEELAHRIKSMEKELAYADQCDAKILNRNGQLEGTIREVEGVLFS